MRQRAATALTRLADRAEWLGAGAEAVAYARRLVSLDPLVEENHRVLIRLLLAGGEVAAAQTQYSAMASLLEEQLGVTPEPATVALRGEIAAGRSSSPHPVRLAVPVPAQAIVGRAAEIDGIVRRFTDDGARAITLTGCGGVGKTRLVIEVAAVLAGHFDDGAVFVDLSAVDDDVQVATAVADAVGVSDRAHRDVAEALATELAAQHLLLVLDNFEQVLAAARLFARLLERCPHLAILATSRLPLGIQAEHQVVLEPLPDDDAVTLFAARAKAAGARALEGPAVLADCREICRRVDGLPLAIELVAAGARFRPPAALLAELDHPLALASRSCDVPARHRTMRAAIQWSVDLLEEPTRCLFARLAAFAGGWTPDAARALASDIDDVDRRLDALLQASMIRQQHGGRMSMLGTFRQFAAEQLDIQPAAEQIRDRHAGYFADVAGAAADGLLSPSARAWTERIGVEQDNMRAAYAHAMSRGHIEQALVIAAGPWRYHWMRGLVRDALDRVLGALAAAGHVASDVRSAALRAAGTLAVAVGDFSLATGLLERAVTVARVAGDQLLVQSALTNLGFARAEQGEIAAAIDALDESLGLARELDGRKAKFPLGVLAAAHSRLGNFALASELAAEALRLNRQLDDPEGTADGLRTLAVAVHGLGDDALARRLAAEALARHRALGHDSGIGLDMAVLGDLDSAVGLFDEARDHYDECLRRWRRSGNPVHSARVLDQLAVLLAPTEPSRAVELFAVAGATRDRADARLVVGERAAIDSAQERCRVALGDARFQAARASGNALTIGQAIELALCR